MREKKIPHGRSFVIKFLKSIMNITEVTMVAKDLIKKLVASHLEIPSRLMDVVAGYVMSLMLESPKHTQTFASAVTDRNQTQYSRLLTDHGDLAKNSLADLGQTTGRAIAKPGRELLVVGAPWTIAIIIDATLHPRSSLHVQNAQRFNHGQGFVVGHQWTNIVISINGRIIPLPPIPFWSKNECKRRGVTYETEHERLKSYLEQLNLSAVAGSYEEDEVVVLTDSGYDDKKLQNTILSRGWDFLTSLKSSRGSSSTNQTHGYRRVDDLFWTMRKHAPWQTVRVEVDGGKKRRKFRARKLVGHIKGITQEVAIVCSEKSGKTGKRYFACSRSGIAVGAMVRAYSKRWEVELFHRVTKHQLGLLDAGVNDFDTLTAHIHWVYCAYILLHELEVPSAKTLTDKQRRLTILANNGPWEDRLRSIVAAKTQCGGREGQQILMGMALRQATTL